MFRVILALQIQSETIKLNTSTKLWFCRCADMEPHVASYRYGSVHEHSSTTGVSCVAPYVPKILANQMKWDPKIYRMRTDSAHNARSLLPADGGD